MMVLKVRSQWVGKKVDLALLSRCVEDFFKGRGFRTKIDELVGEYKILVISPRAERVRGDVDVRISGDPNDFVIEFSAGEGARFSIKLGFLTTMIGGGSILLRGLKLREALEKLEREFWVYAEDSVAHLADSAGR